MKILNKKKELEKEKTTQLREKRATMEKLAEVITEKYKIMAAITTSLSIETDPANKKMMYSILENLSEGNLMIESEK